MNFPKKIMAMLFIASVSAPVLAQNAPSMPSAPSLPSSPEVAENPVAGLVKEINQDECSIWLCLPGGFPDGCGKALSAMKKRLKKGKSPLPSFSSCSADGDDHGLWHYESRVMRVEEHEECVESTYEIKEKGRENTCFYEQWKEYTCKAFKKVPVHYVKNMNECTSVNSLRDGVFCHTEVKLAEITQYGKKIGEGAISERRIFHEKGGAIGVESFFDDVKFKDSITWDGKFRRPVGSTANQWKEVVKSQNCLPVSRD